MSFISFFETSEYIIYKPSVFGLSRQRSCKVVVMSSPARRIDVLMCALTFSTRLNRKSRERQKIWKRRRESTCTVLFNETTQ